MLSVGVNIGESAIEVGLVTARLGCLLKRKFSSKKYTTVKHYTGRLILEIEILLDHFPDHHVAGIGVAVSKPNSVWNIPLIENSPKFQAGQFAEYLLNYFDIRVELISQVNARKLGNFKFKNSCDPEILGAASQFLTVIPRL